MMGCAISHRQDLEAWILLSLGLAKGCKPEKKMSDYTLLLMDWRGLKEGANEDDPIGSCQIGVSGSHPLK